MDKVNIAIIGAGVVGLAIAAELSKKYQDIVLLEKETSFGQGTSSRNSEIIHAGIYYVKDSLKARLCVEGNNLLYDFCRVNHISHARTGKIIVAKDESEVAQLEELMQRGIGNGVRGMRYMEAEEITRFEPEVAAVRALFSPGTGIIDSHALMKCLEQKAKDNGTVIAYGSEVRGVRYEGNSYVINVTGEDALETKVLINSAGLSSDRIAAMAGIDIEKNRYQLYYCKGEYFSYNKPSFLKHLVYPVPEAEVKSLGIHAVIDLAGGLKFGPSAEYVDVIDYNVNPANKSKFAAAVKSLFPQVKEDDLSPDQAGIRPKLQGPGEGFRDFVISEESDQGFPGLVNLIGIESPGLTACLGIAQDVLKLVDIF